MALWWQIPLFFGLLAMAIVIPKLISKNCSIAWSCLTATLTTIIFSASQGR
ncbi:MAG: hypothetical protein AAB731_01545 [Patescibacteria group bacterium]